MKSTLPLLLLALVGAAALLGSPWMNEGFELADLSTGTRQQLFHDLPDGSHLVLEANSAVDVEYDARQRRLKLLEGRLSVQVADDDPRPFLLATEHGILTTRDARFSVSRRADHSQVRLQAGSAELESASLRLPLAAGQSALFDHAGPTLRQP
ncbi:FecR domain-containing protein [Pantoea sp. Cy-639]|uniref:FecR family protein n=1 Tax=Pantoea sp. Cy-639 TaxID=2608360 RepID=UPI00141E449B|nr:FecR domain-containing protein [Pantoea sp. Cy-639]